MKTLAEGLDVRGAEGQPGSLAMAAEFREQLGHSFECLEQMECGNTAAGTGKMPVLSGLAQDEYRAREALHQAAGDDSEHTQMPFGAREHQRRAIVQQQSVFFAARKNCFDNFRFRALAFAVKNI